MRTNGTSHLANVADKEGIDESELNQLANIGTAEIDSNEWSRLASLDQGVATSDNVQFANLTTTGSTTFGSAGFTGPTGYIKQFGAGSLSLEDASLLVGNGLTGPTGTISLNETAVTPGSYTQTNLTVDANGRITTASSYVPFYKEQVKVSSTTTLNLAINVANGETLDGVSLVTGDRILIKNQSTASQNGIYIVTAGAPDRSTDFASGSSQSGAVIPVDEGTLNADSVWFVTTNSGSDVVGTNTLAFQHIAKASLLAGTGLEASGNTIRISAAAGGDGIGGGGGSALAVDSTVVRTSGTQTIGGAKTFSSPFSIIQPTLSSGQLLISTTTTNGVQKYGTIACLHGTSAEQPLLFLAGTSGPSGTDNLVWFGGGMGEFNAATQLGFYTAANNTTTTGTERMRVLSTGLVGINVTDPDTRLEVLDGGGNPQLKLSFDGTDHSNFQVDTNGDLTITPSGTNFIVPKKGTFSGGLLNSNAVSSGVITSGGAGMMAGGYCSGSGSTITASGEGSVAGGYTIAQADIQATGNGSFARGYIKSDADTNSGILADGLGAIAVGYCAETTSTITSSGQGSFAGGEARDNASIISSGSGSLAYGWGWKASSGSAVIEATETGAVALGTSLTGSHLTASASGTLVNGHAAAIATISATAPGAHAEGICESGGVLSAQGNGSYASGYAAGVNMIASGVASRVTGRRGTASGDGSMIHSCNTAAQDTASHTSCLILGDGTNTPTLTSTANNEAHFRYTGGMTINNTICPAIPSGAFFYAGTYTTTASAASDLELDVSYTEGLDASSSWSLSNPIINYTGAKTRHFFYRCEFSITSTVAAASTLTIWLEYKTSPGGSYVSMPSAECDRYLSGTSDSGSASLQGYLSTGNDYYFRVMINSTNAASRYNFLHTSVAISQVM